MDETGIVGLTRRKKIKTDAENTLQKSQREPKLGGFQYVPSLAKSKERFMSQIWHGRQRN